GGWLADQGRELPEGPHFAAGCDPANAGSAGSLSASTAAGAGRPPAIVSPGRGQVVVLIPGLPTARQQVPLQAETAAPVISWFVDGELVGTVPSRSPLYWRPVPGRHTVVVADEGGRKDRRTLEVRLR